MKFSEIINDQQLATEAIRRWITVAVCVVLALLVADWIATQQFLMLALLAGVTLAAFVTVGMHRKAWLLIVVSWSFLGYIHALPIPMATRDVVVLVATFSYVAQRVVGQSSRRPRGALGALVIINCAYIAFTFVCHPIGLHVLGSETIGGRPYFNIFIALCAYWVIVNLPESYESVTRIPLWVMVGVTFSSLISVVVYIFPSITPYVWFFYSNVDVSDYLGSLNPAAGAESEVHRFITLAPFGVMLIQLLASYYSPRKFLNPARWQFYLCALAFAAIFASGFRNSLAIALASVVLAARFHRGWREIALGGAMGALLLGFLVFGQGRLFKLPLPAQRALGSFPGQWDDVILNDVKISNSRWDWWRQIIEEGGAAKNWVIGDGFGLSEEDFTLISGGRLGFEESASINGGFHNGPLTTLRSVGMIGLILFYTLMIAAAISSVKCVRRCRGTPLLPAAIFLAIQLVWTPVHFTVFFGSYQDQLPNHMFLIGLLTLVWRMSEQDPPSTAPALSARPLSSNNGRALVSR